MLRRTLPLALALAACADRDPVDPVDPLADAGPDPTDARPVDPPPVVTTCPVSGTLAQPSLVETDPTVLARFGFARVLDRLRATAGASGQTSLALFQGWWRSFGASPAAGDCDDPGVDPQRFGLQCPRAPEAALGAVDPLSPSSGVRFRPVGLFDRLDLAPGDGATCGEYRIVYALDAGPGAAIGGRALVIFEAALPNPDRARGLDGCLPVARFWQALSAEADPAVRAARLEQLYFTGGAVPGFPAVVDAAHYGLADAGAPFAAGQIRTNTFVDSVEWSLREFKLRRTCATPSSCRLAFELVPVKANPAEALFAGTHPGSTAFVGAFTAQLGGLLGADPATLTLDVPELDDTYESVSQPATATVRYALRASNATRAAVQRELIARGSPLTTTQVLARATTQTCAGCHEISSNADLGGGLAWPPSNGFTQIDEAGTLSPALTSLFLPHRLTVLERFINARCGAAKPAVGGDPHRTLGGGLVGAAH